MSERKRRNREFISEKKGLGEKSRKNKGDEIKKLEEKERSRKRRKEKMEMKDQEREKKEGE
jgi:hypothetical protein